MECLAWGEYRGEGRGVNGENMYMLMGSGKGVKDKET
jgi:hypothetical protein